MDQYVRRRSACWLLIAGCLAVSLFCLVYPVFVIRPFRYQGPRELAVALFVLRIRPALVAICMVADSPPLPTSTDPDATACIRCTRLGKVMISASMPSGFKRSGIRNMAFVVVVKAVPNFTFRSD